MGTRSQGRAFDADHASDQHRATTEERTAGARASATYITHHNMSAAYMECVLHELRVCSMQECVMHELQVLAVLERPTDTPLVKLVIA